MKCGQSSLDNAIYSKTWSFIKQTKKNTQLYSLLKRSLTFSQREDTLVHPVTK